MRRRDLCEGNVQLDNTQRIVYDILNYDGMAFNCILFIRSAARSSSVALFDTFFFPSMHRTVSFQRCITYMRSVSAHSVIPYNVWVSSSFDVGLFD